MPLLNPGDPFPRLTISTTDGQTLAIPDAFAGDFGVVLLYRGAWCPYCNAQLRTFERAGETLADAGVKVAALSVDDKESTAALVARHWLTFPVGYGAVAPAIASLTGAFVNPDPVYLQSTGFVLDPAGKVIVGVYSSGKPRMNSVMERWVQACRRELLDRTLIWNQRHLLHALREFEGFYSRHAPSGHRHARPLRPLPRRSSAWTDRHLDIRRLPTPGRDLHDYEHAA